MELLKTMWLILIPILWWLINTNGAFAQDTLTVGTKISSELYAKCTRLADTEQFTLKNHEYYIMLKNEYEEITAKRVVTEKEWDFLIARNPKIVENRAIYTIIRNENDLYKEIKAIKHD